VLIGAAVAAALCAAMRRPGASTIFLAWLLHWPADLFTGRKPLLFREPLIGLDLYKIPLADFALESVVVLIGCAIYARTYPSRGEMRRVIVILGAVLIAMQAAVDVALSVMRSSEWTPSFAWIERRSRPRMDRVGARAGGRMLALRPSYPLHEEAMASDGPRGIVTLVCLTCGKEKFFTREVPAAVSCEQCGSTVFRTFMTPTEPDEAAIDALEAQARSMAYGDSSPDTTRDDVRDLDMR
jgi:DNA-directed RNA polymerase subunit RPC12/RpoP